MNSEILLFITKQWTSKQNQTRLHWRKTATTIWKYGRKEEKIKTHMQVLDSYLIQVAVLKRVT